MTLKFIEFTWLADSISRSCLLQVSFCKETHTFTSGISQCTFLVMNYNPSAKLLFNK